MGRSLLLEEKNMAMRRGGFIWEEKKGWQDKEGSFVKVLGDSSWGKSMIPHGGKMRKI